MFAFIRTKNISKYECRICAQWGGGGAFEMLCEQWQQQKGEQTPDRLSTPSLKKACVRYTVCCNEKRT